jgi:hypothetical protein
MNARRRRKEDAEVADYYLTGVWLNGERIIVDDARLKTFEGLQTSTWSVELDGAHMLAARPNDRVKLAMTTDDSREIEGEAQVASAGRHDERSKVYNDVQFTGLTPLHERA